MPSTLEAIVLLGWMEREEATDFLRNRCLFDPPLNQDQALALWEDYHHRVGELPTRTISVPRRRLVSSEEDDWERRFLEFTRRAGGNAKCLIKVNLMELVVHQKHILTVRASDYGSQLRDCRSWNQMCLPVQPDQCQVQVKVRTNNFGLEAAVDIDIPHGEWLLLPLICNGEFHLKPAPALKYVTVTQPEPDRMLLLAGYHRSYAWALRTQADGTECPALVALAENLIAPAIAGNETAFDRLVRGPRPPLFADFFDDRLLMRVALHRKRPQMQIRSQIVWIDDP